MPIYNCPKCKDNFKYQSLLKRHLQTSVRCISTNDYITNLLIENINKDNNINNNIDNSNININIENINNIDNIENIDNNNNSNIEIKLFTCNDCNSNFKFKTSLYKHKRNSKCSRNKIPNEINNTTNNNLTNSNNTINNTINNITNNNIINNNNTIIQHINPFGFEDVRTIPITEMKTILTSGQEAGIEIIKTIYNKIENKNFYKPNISKPEIACLNKDFNLTIYKTREFADALFDRCIAFLHHILYLCKNEYTKNNIKYIYDNIEHIETTMRTEIYDKKLKNIIETEFINNNINNKDRIKKFIKKFREETDIKDNSLLQIKNTTTLNKDNNNEYKISITSLELNNVFGDPKIILGLRKEEIIINLRISRFEESIFYNFWIDRIKSIKKYIMNNKKSTIGDIANMSKEENKINTMLEIIKRRVENNRGDDYLDLNINDEFRLQDVEDSGEVEYVNTTNTRNLHSFDSLVSR
jgi:hypothetical protein